ncbi:type I-B CRISPR-associated protein Cas8b1/Cst1 [Scopulibacillus cellulosilyticus]|uniref:Type I-B CRISPR-associated protein Cas8b1/Cst1 n=1 Tax=Scopulibacillus cellulosilyticus TaxID=2665665 RepID=A0ABW2PX83_9BACL
MNFVLPMSEWHLNQGLLGYYRILKKSGVDVQTTDDGLVFDTEHLEVLPQAMFNYYLDKYSVKAREGRIIQSYWSKFANGDKNAKKEINDRLKKQIYDKVKKYYSETPSGAELLENIEKFRAEKTYSEELSELLNTIFKGLETPEIHDKLTANFFKAVILGPYFGQVSFLNVVKNDLTIPQQIELFTRDFVQPVIEEIKFLDLLKSAKNEKQVTNFIENGQHKGIKSLKRPLKKLSLNEIKAYIKDTVNKCSFFEDFLGFEQFNEGVFSPLALSAGNAINFSWNANGKVSIPISAIAKLILFCSPAGATMSGNKSIFVQNEGIFAELLKVNEHYSNQKNMDKSFDEIIFDLVAEQQLKADYTMKNFLILEYESDYQAKKTLLDYMTLTPELTHLFKEHNKLFSYMSYRFRVSLIHDLLNYKDTKQLLFYELREKIKHQYSSLEIIYATLIRHFYQCYQKGGVQMSMDTKKQSSYIWVLYKSGASIQRIVGEKKAQGIAYRLLNTVKSGNKKQFMDTIMRVYISANQQMPSLFLNVLHEEKMDFATVADSWIAGLISKKNEVGDETND